MQRICKDKRFHKARQRPTRTDIIRHTTQNEIETDANGLSKIDKNPEDGLSNKQKKGSMQKFVGVKL